MMLEMNIKIFKKNNIDRVKVIDASWGIDEGSNAAINDDRKNNILIMFFRDL